MSAPVPAAHESSLPLSAMHGRAALWIFLSLCVVYLGTTRGHFNSTDEIAVYETTRSLWHSRDVAISPEVSTSALPGRDGRHYAVYGIGQSVAALPLYGLGMGTRHLLERVGLDSWARAIGGPVLPQSDGSRWGGDVEIFFVNLLNVVATALLAAVFFAFSLRLGASPGWALVSTLLLALTSYVAPFSTGFFQHSAEALFLLWAFYFLFADRQSPSWKLRALAGVMAAVMLLFRFSSAMALPGLTLYLIWSAAGRRPVSQELGAGLLRRLVATVPFLAPVAAAICVHAAVNHAKFGSLSLAGGYVGAKFDTPLIMGLYGLLLSPGESVFIFTPLLVLVPWTFRSMLRSHRALGASMLVVTACYLAGYGRLEFWHGMWCLGPRYLMPLTPLLLLPLATWMPSAGPKAWLVVAPLALLGLWVQASHVIVNFWYVAVHEGYIDFRPPYGFLFLPEFAPIVAQGRALLAGDGRTDTWLVNVYRGFGLGALLVIVVPLAVALAVCLRNLGRALASVRHVHVAPAALSFACGRPAVALALVLVAGTAFGMVTDPGGRPSEPRIAARDAVAWQEGMMQAGLARLYTQGDPLGAAARFSAVLTRNRDHFGAAFQLATALDRAGKRQEARPVWGRVVELAERYGDTATRDRARARLEEQP